MLGRLRQVHKLSPFARGDHAKPANPAAARQPEIASSAMKIIHAGGRIECYYMATPAARILEKYPSHYLAKPEVFRRPWDSVVRREKILIPGQKFLLVPRHTVKKLRRKIRQPSKELSSVPSASRASNDTSVDMVSRQNIDVPSSSFFSQSDISVSRDTKRSCRSALRKETGFPVCHLTKLLISTQQFLPISPLPCISAQIPTICKSRRRRAIYSKLEFHSKNCKAIHMETAGNETKSSGYSSRTCYEQKHRESLLT